MLTCILQPQSWLLFRSKVSRTSRYFSLRTWWIEKSHVSYNFTNPYLFFNNLFHKSKRYIHKLILSLSELRLSWVVFRSETKSKKEFVEYTTNFCLNAIKYWSAIGRLQVLLHRKADFMIARREFPYQQQSNQTQNQLNLVQVPNPDILRMFSGRSVSSQIHSFCLSVTGEANPNEKYFYFQFI